MIMLVRFQKGEEQATDLTVELTGNYLGPGPVSLHIQGLDGHLIFDYLEWKALTCAGQRALEGEKKEEEK